MKKRKDRAMSDWDNLVEPTRGALEALLRKGDAMAERIKELEAKLAKAVEALVQMAGKRYYADDPWGIARTTLAELKGENDE
jgi:TPP-dependent pyruvate/acetoin dehydrogenase alpha subunit